MLINVWKTVASARAEKADLSDTEVLVAKEEATAHGSVKGRGWHYELEGKTFAFSVLALVSVLVGTIVELVPMIAVRSNIPTIDSVKPYTPLELEGRDIYIREGCYNCHSQMIRTLPEEYIRYGEPSKSGEFVYDHPFQFGSKRTGPDLQRVGGKYPDYWHFRHMLDPRSTSPGSIMPTYGWLYTDTLETSLTSKKLKVMKQLGAPYTDEEVHGAVSNLEAQAKGIVDGLYTQGVPNSPGLERREIISLIAYLQRLGKDAKGK